MRKDLGRRRIGGRGEGWPKWRIGILCGEISLDEALWYIMSNLGDCAEWSVGKRGEGIIWSE